MFRVLLGFGTRQPATYQSILSVLQNDIGVIVSLADSAAAYSG